MTALDFAEQLDSYAPAEKGYMLNEAAAMLRAQHEAIKTLREALEVISKTKPQHGMNPNAYMSDPDDIKVGWNVHWKAKAALAATEEICKD